VRYSVRVHDRERRSGSACFDDAAKATRDALVLLGHEVIPSFGLAPGTDPGRAIIFGANNDCNWLPGDAVIFNAEQVSAEGHSLMKNLSRYRQHVVWDYSQTNVDWLKANGVDRAVLCPIGYVPSMERVKPAPLDVDILWYGSLNERRQEVLAALEDARLGVRRLANVYGKARSEWIGRSKVVLNWHFYDRPVFEIFRCSFLLANRKAVVTEGGGLDPGLEELAKDACAVVTRENVVETCRELCADANKRQALEMRGYEAFKKIDFTESVRRALAASDICV